ncbi:MAG: hypothetical protein ABSG43_02225 [Solirubrobacteraceae bacterium]|jgi:hypothetical protein
MREDEPGREGFDEMLRSFAREVSRSAERMTQLDMDEIASAIGVDPTRAKEWVDSAGKWLRSQAEVFGGEGAVGSDPDPDLGEARSGRSGAPPPADDPLRHAAPHPLDLPTDEQGLALAALDSGRWTIEPGASALAPHGEGPRPRDALGLVRELHVRDWITGEGAVTLAGRRALSRWLESTTH